MRCLRPSSSPFALLLLASTALLSSSCDDGGSLSATWALCADPAELDFGPVPLRTPVVRSVGITNCGNVPVDALTAEIGDAVGAETTKPPFVALQTEVPSPLPPGGRFFMPVRFFGQVPGPYEARLRLLIDEAGADAIVNVQLRGEATVPATCDVRVEPETLAFGEVDIGETAEGELTLTNDGAEPCALSGARVTEGFEQFSLVDEGGDALEPGAATTVRVRYTPAAPGNHTGVFAEVLDGAREVGAALTGIGVARDRCVLDYEPAPLVLPRASVGFSTTSAATTVRSTGELPCTVSDFAVVEADSGFSVTTAPAAGIVLQPGDEAEVIVTLSPTSTGPLAATLRGTTDDGGEHDVELVGFGDPAPTCALVVTPAPVVFEPLGVGLEAEQAIELRNDTDMACSFDATLSAESGPDFTLVGNGAGLSLLPGESADLAVRFAPGAAAPALGALALTFSDGGEQQIALIGFGDYGDLVLTPGLVWFGAVTEGCVSRTHDLTLTNVGPVAARLDLVAPTLASDPNFELLTAPTVPSLLGAGETAPLSMRMLAGPMPGSHAGHLAVSATGAREPLVRTQLFGFTESEADAARTDVFMQTERPAVDILFVVDNSGSMQAEQNNLAANFGQFIQFTTGLDIDYHIAIVTTDTSDGSSGVFVAPFISNVGSHASADPIAEFVSAVNVGTTGSATEKGLEASVLALTEPLVSTLNGGFLREHALLSVIYVSDEDDQSPGDTGDWVDALLALKGYDANAVMASAIAGDVPAGCHENGNDASAAKRYLDVVLGLGGIFESICTNDWANAMEQLGTGTFAALTRFELSRRPDTTTIIVSVDGQPVPEGDLNGWTFNPETNAITFNGTSVPEAGEQIEISYTAECIAP
jgi:hypothetical protein